MKVPSLGTNAKKIMTQPLLTNKLNRWNMYRWEDITFEDMQHNNIITLLTFCRRIQLKLCGLFCLHLGGQKKQVGFYSLGQNLPSFNVQDFVKWQINLCKFNKQTTVAITLILRLLGLLLFRMVEGYQSFKIQNCWSQSHC